MHGKRAEALACLVLYRRLATRQLLLPPCSVQLRVAGLPTAQLAEVARDLLALWGWQAAQRRQQQAAAAQEPQPRSGSDSGGAPAGAAANNHAADSASAAGGALPPPLLPPLPLPPLNFPLDAYAEQTRLLADLAELPGAPAVVLRGDWYRHRGSGACVL